MGRTASVIVRCKDKAATIEATLRAVRDQSVPAELVVVDSGSTDGTLEIARRYVDRLVELAPSEFNYGRALNVGARAASGDVHFALSAHCVPLSRTWVEDSLRYYDRPDVAGTNHAPRRPDGQPLDDVFYQTAQDAVRTPTWGFSNHGSSWRADVWRELPFREDLAATEDREWSWRVLARGYVIAFAPELAVSVAHRRADGLRAYWRRIRRERGTMISLGGVAAPTLSESLRTWWSPERVPGYRSPVLRRLSPFRAVEIAAAYSVRNVERRPSSLDELRASVGQE